MNFTAILDWVGKSFDDLMGLRKSFRDWKNERDYQRGDKEFCAGFGYAMVDYYIKRTPIDTLEARAFGVGDGTDEFERGMFLAVQEIRKARAADAPS